MYRPGGDDRVVGEPSFCNCLLLYFDARSTSFGEHSYVASVYFGRHPTHQLLRRTSLALDDRFRYKKIQCAQDPRSWIEQSELNVAGCECASALSVPASKITCPVEEPVKNCSH